jgi:hypothetical protein
MQHGMPNPEPAPVGGLVATQAASRPGAQFFSLAAKSEVL